MSHITLTPYDDNKFVLSLLVLSPGKCFKLETDPLVLDRSGNITKVRSRKNGTQITYKKVFGSLYKTFYCEVIITNDSISIESTYRSGEPHIKVYDPKCYLLMNIEGKTTIDIADSSKCDLILKIDKDKTTYNRGRLIIESDILIKRCSMFQVCSYDINDMAELLRNVFSGANITADNERIHRKFINMSITIDFNNLLEYYESILNCLYYQEFYIGPCGTSVKQASFK
jgi:hypothetical protein